MSLIVALMLFAQTATLVPGTVETWTNGAWVWDGNNPFCADAGLLPQPGSQASVGQIGACYNVRAATIGGWVFCADENGSCSFQGTKEVRYGANGVYALRRMVDGVGCNNTVFGDPAVGVGKHCDMRDPVAVAPAAPVGLGVN